MKRLPGIDALLASYDAFVVDQYGTLHDGTALYPGALDALRRLRAAGKAVALLSNSGKRSAANVHRLTRLGIGADDYDLFITSGEVAWQLLAQGRIPIAHGVTRCLLLERDGDGTFFDGLDQRSVAADEAELVVIAGSEGERISLDDYLTSLRPLVARGVPALCTNPDRHMLTPRGLAFGTGVIAELYAKLGGTVTWVGKPYRESYDLTLGLLGVTASPQIVGIGDSVEHDVAGARAAGCAAWLVRAGIIAGADDATIAAECRRYGVAPDGILEAFA